MRELCRNFQRGSCQYGERCRFLHAVQQQPKANPFGFGTQNASNNSQKPNPFGFGVQSSPQQRGTTDFGSRPNQFKPFENKWSRFSPIPNANAPSFRKSDNQSQAANHTCTDPESCKSEIAKDFESERPIWKLTCYGHLKYAPCDIFNDVSAEELRAAAYEDAKRGLSLQSIVERERNLLNSKLAEFEDLLRRPYVAPSNSAASQSIIPGLTTNAFSNFSQTSAPGSNIVPSLGRGSLRTITQSWGYEDTILLAQYVDIKVTDIETHQTCNKKLTGQNTNMGSFGNQLAPQVQASTLPFNLSNFDKSAPPTAGSNLFANPVSSQIVDSTSSLSTSSIGQTNISIQMKNGTPLDSASGDTSIWLKKKWKRGEIPEVAPPDAFI